ncbi:hypothetical protein JF732_18850 [Mycobacterium intracellulare]|uniref:Uncharacterized protein n=1 Tax=Mycobacterium intracellulare TaxID=1767 RepID=A0AAE4UE52_MYCIT|nr:hypothetical protein [Mycobacterium intracellulare]ETZ31178.1 hypothetical protein L842_2239 [Mycobacterium intracellulare MIN_052511_1280]MCA2320703.1 hypothetical protein [Mycobacterium intracellulare]MCA2342601.1 hypothetical protein [Mycobacterium intracellulare]MDV6978188.1 hypothetical protein [Mycobacterium intracellulare]MDV6983611.1 hypothetical protein [Mycobacterium intracellulare]
MTEPSYTAADAILHTAACVEQMRNEFQRVRDAAPDTATARDFADYVLAYVGRLFEGIQQHQVVHGAHGDHYSSGIPVSTIVDLAGGARWEKAWHPAPAHPLNQPRTLAERIPLGDGSTAAVIASAPGVLDVVRQPSPNVV